MIEFIEKLLTSIITTILSYRWVRKLKTIYGFHCKAQIYKSINVLTNSWYGQLKMDQENL